MNNKELPARIRFLLQDTVELRENNWVPRKAFIDNGPKTINQIRQDAVKVCHDGIGTGPGVIQDRYSPTMGRHRTNPLFNGHSGHIAPPQQSQFDMGPKSFVKSSQISLRPAQSFLLNKNQVPKLQPQIPTMMPPSAQPPRTQTPPLGQEAIMTEYLNTKNLTEAVNGVREMKAPRHFLPEMLSKIIVCSLDRPDEDKEHASTLIHTLRLEGLITGENFMQAFLNVLDQCQKIELDVPLVKSYLAQFAARAIIAELVSVAELAHPLENGTHFPLFLLCLQQTAKLKDREWLMELFQQSKVNMQKMLPGTELLSLSFTMDCFNVEHN
ncbi:hypothetical protein GOODEAATRI_002730 [Goodea atripinnis]|uniref:MI domain-containing protein n=1 Tax=Goodea atripinnis TaxID=208336 RepID=A0ABV0N7C2_9TELE